MAGKTQLAKKVYIAGPMRGIKDFNFPAFDAARDLAKSLGYDPISPADIDREEGFEGIGLNGRDDEWVGTLSKEATIQRDIDAIKVSNAIALLPGYEKSSGATVELSLARFLDKEILDATTFKPFAVTGRKDDGGKLRYDLVAPDALAGLVSVLTFGANKYSARNWEGGIAYGRVFAATLRHLFAWFCREPFDIETGISHLDHAACCIHFLSAYEKRNMKTFDDRPMR